MENTPAPEGGNLAVEKGPEPVPENKGREAPFGPSYPEPEKLGEELAANFPKPPTSAKEEAKTAGAIAARQIPTTKVPQPEASQNQANLKAIPTTRKADPINLAGCRFAALRKTLRGRPIENQEQKQAA